MTLNKVLLVLALVLLLIAGIGSAGWVEGVDVITLFVFGVASFVASFLP